MCCNNTFTYLADANLNLIDTARNFVSIKRIAVIIAIEVEKSVKPKTSASLVNFYALISMKFYSELLKLRFARPIVVSIEDYFSIIVARGVHHGEKV